MKTTENCNLETHRKNDRTEKLLKSSSEIKFLTENVRQERNSGQFSGTVASYLLLKLPNLLRILRKFGFAKFA